MQNEELDLTEYSGTLRGAVPKMIVAGLILGVLAVVATYFMKPVWEVETRLLMAENNTAPSLESLLGPQAGNPLNILKGILKSRTAMDRIAKANGVERKDLEESIKISTSAEDNQLTINVKWKGQERALAIARSALTTLDDMKQSIGFSVAARQGKLLEKLIGKETTQLHAAEEKVKAYQKTMTSLADPSNPSSILDLLRQEKQMETDLNAMNLQIERAKERVLKVKGAAPDIPTSLPNATEWQKRLSKAEYDLKIAQINQASTAPTVVRLTHELEVTRSQVQKEIANYYKSVEQNLDADTAALLAQRDVLSMRLQIATKMAKNAPAEALELARLAREVAILTNTLSALRQQYEMKKVDEEGDVSYSVLEDPHFTDDEPINKKFGRNGFVGFVLGGMLVAAWRIFGQRKRSFGKVA